MTNKTGLIQKISLYALIVIFLVTTIMPFAWMFITSLRVAPNTLIMPPPPVGTATFSNYITIFENADFFGSLINSVIVTFSLTGLSVLINAMAAYCFAKLNFPGREKLFALLILTMMVPGKVTMMPVFIILKSLNMLNSYTGLIISGSASVYAIFMLRQFMYDIPDELIESARIDGCGEFRLFFSIILPLCKPVLATVVIINFIGAWNELLWPLIIMIDEKMYTL
ncbi:MAG TPA: carbohydrate ABC transporter permease, partial [Candidatus Wallbacteria bacterium]|nr:carbohydrate ABC transporter permease [Candidatus Wallbacteria bacterium]